MPGRIPNLPTAWENRIFSRTFQTEVQKASNKNEAEKREVEQISSQPTRSNEQRGEEQDMISTRNKISSPTSPNICHRKDSSLVLSRRPVTHLLPKVQDINDTDTDESNFGDEMNEGSDFSTDADAKLDIERAAHVQRTYANQFDAIITSLTAVTAALPTKQASSKSHPDTLDDVSSSISTQANTSLKSSNESEKLAFFPLELAAAGLQPSISPREAKELERTARNRNEIEKQNIAEAKLAVSEARLNEFEAKLSARQARVNERHANLCHRRAVIKDAEERLHQLESRLDASEQEHREREQRIRNRERRSKQEVIKLQIMESEVRKRETKISQSLEDIERRKKLVEQKEAISSIMSNLVTEKEFQKVQKEAYSPPKSEQTPDEKKIQNELPIQPKSSREMPPFPSSSILRRSPDKRGKPNNSWQRYSSYDGEVILREDVTAIGYSKHIGSVPRNKNKGVMGLWL